MRIVVLCLALFLSPVSNGDYSSRAEVKAFIDEMVTEEGFSGQELERVFRQASYKQSIIDAISRPAEKVLTWKEYQDIFLTRKRVSRGTQFLMENHEALVAAKEKYGVPPVVIAAIIGVETMYGRITGSYRVIDALATLAFDYPPRSPFFRGELKHFLMLVREEGQSPLDPLGSYAGAMGYGQFIPSSYRHYAVDFDGDGSRDIWQNPTDAIGSVANYLAEHGWRQGEPVAYQVTVSPEVEAAFGSTLKPSVTLGELGPVVVGDAPIDGTSMTDESLVSPIRLEGKRGSEFWVGHQNFYVITRYNHSKLYAMAVFQLSEQLKNPQLAGQADGVR
jgi:membrane-bound lytic murein transglycosylase B